MTKPRTRLATALLVRDGRALLGHRVLSRLAFPGRWGLIGGHVEPGETPRQAVSRECVEELRVRIRQPHRIPMMVTASGIEMHAFLVTRWAAEPLNAAPEEHSGVRWFTPDEIARLKLAHPESLPDILNAIRLVSDLGTPGSEASVF